jgi:hypothetical protein
MFGCEDEPAEPGSCIGFEVGADMSGRFDGDRRFEAFAQAAADLASVASSSTAEVTASCKALAVDFGAEQAPGDEPADPSEAVAYWCAAAGSQLAAQLQGSLGVLAQPASCAASFEVQSACELGCQVDSSCQPGSVEERCDASELAVTCEGACTGTCEGAADLAVLCEGSCLGSCEGACDGAPSDGACLGICSGRCRGSCAIAGGGVSCEGDCSGGCDGSATAPKCKGAIAPPTCDVDAGCQASCEASAVAKAACRAPAIVVVASGGLDDSLVGSLELRLPSVVLAAQARVDALAAAAREIREIGARHVASERLEDNAALCIDAMMDALATASRQLDATLAASLALSHAAGG